ncbi:hypothetical protein ACFLW5_02310, partial [Chloroflexota bacterium]
MKLTGLVIALFTVLLLLLPTKVSAATTSNISKQLICQCGCNLVLESCAHIECTSREAMTAVIEQKLSQEESEEQIIQYFVTQYG